MSATIFSPEARARIAARIEAGVSLPEAARAAGVKPATAKSWLARGRHDVEGPYAAFAAEVETAREVAAARPAPMTPAEFRHQVEAAIRNGSTQAMKIWADLFLDADDEAPESGSVIDMLAAQRKRKGTR
jgi:hypothetical protein